MRSRKTKRLMMSGILPSLFLVSASAGQSARKQPCLTPSSQMLERSQQYLQNTPCAPLVTACNKGGYILGCSVVKMGLVWQCMLPLLGGKQCRESKCFQQIQTSQLASSSVVLILARQQALQRGQGCGGSLIR